jgi:hypothetical protein
MDPLEEEEDDPYIFTAPLFKISSCTHPSIIILISNRSSNKNKI